VVRRFQCIFYFLLDQLLKLLLLFCLHFFCSFREIFISYTNPFFLFSLYLNNFLFNFQFIFLLNLILIFLQNLLLRLFFNFLLNNFFLDLFHYLSFRNTLFPFLLLFNWRLFLQLFQLLFRLLTWSRPGSWSWSGPWSLLLFLFKVLSKLVFTLWLNLLFLFCNIFRIILFFINWLSNSNNRLLFFSLTSWCFDSEFLLNNLLNGLPL